MPSPDRPPAEWPGPEPQPSRLAREEGSTTPRRPSFSPVTPTISHASLVSGDHHARPVPEWIDEPEPLPLSLEDNPDAIALRAAISILQLQRQQSLRDIKTLDKMKASALQQPQKFVEDFKAGKLTKPDPVAILDVDDSDDGLTDNIATANVSQFGTFPNAQNIVRAPPINWGKYHVVGESLDKLHEQQRKRPGADDPTEEHMGLQPEHAIAAPYGPFVDKLAPLPTTSRHQDSAT